MKPQMARFMRPTWGPSGANRTLNLAIRDFLGHKGGFMKSMSSMELHQILEVPWNVAPSANSIVTNSTWTKLCMCPANDRWHYIVTVSLIDWTDTQNEPCNSLNMWYGEVWVKLKHSAALHSILRYLSSKELTKDARLPLRYEAHFWVHCVNKILAFSLFNYV